MGREGCERDEDKSKGSGIMISDFLYEKNGYLALTDEEYEEAKKNAPTVRKYAHQHLEYCEANEGYWTPEKFMGQIKEPVEIAEVKYPKEAGWRMLNHSSCHAAMPDDALNASRVTVNSGGK